MRAVPLGPVLFLGLSLCIASAPELREAPKKIAVVGAGVGGTAAAYFLRQEFGAEVQIDVFEAGQVGGRLASVHVEGAEYDAGVSGFHPLNLHMKHFADTLGLPVRGGVPSLRAVLDGPGLVLEESEWLLVTVLRLLWRHGLGLLRLALWVEGELDKLMRVYQFQQFGYSFSSVERLLHAIGGDDFLRLTNQTLGEALQGAGFSQHFVNEIVIPVTRGSYGQSVKINAFAGVVALAGAGTNRWAVEGGNQLICTGLLYHSKAQLIQATVSTITTKQRPLRTGGSVSLYEVSYTREDGGGHGLYDIVVVATPLQQGTSDITFPGLTPPVNAPFPGRYHPTVTTLVLGCLNTAQLHASPDLQASEILTTDMGGAVGGLGGSPTVYSLTTQDPVRPPAGYRRPPAHQPRVWRVLSSAPLSESQLGTLFLPPAEVVSRRQWLASPAYSGTPHRLPPVVLHERLYYVSAVDWAAAGPELSAVAARNVALLARHRWSGEKEQVDQEDLHARLRGEL
ncbi:prenylcysteine oxidase 1 [Amia ocellicauda]|uniref:prenylcysteine oxidase 1 n=1 Tax=Amia ocellicauda TaxID=2972642 RepID=UPI003464E160